MTQSRCPHAVMPSRAQCSLPEGHEGDHLTKAQNPQWRAQEFNDPPAEFTPPEEPQPEEPPA